MARYIKQEMPDIMGKGEGVLPHADGTKYRHY